MTDSGEKSKHPSFQFYPGDWKGSRWIQFQGLDPMGLPQLPAVYAIYLDKELVYIGQTTNLRKRFRNYRLRWGYGNGLLTPWYKMTVRCDDVSVKARFATRYGDWAMREQRLIRRLQPKFNCVGSQRKRGSYE